MDETNTLTAQRRAKLEALRGKGLDPFRQKFHPQTGCGTARARFLAGLTEPPAPEALAEGAVVAIAGRVTAHRDMGKSQFMDLRDGSGRIQIYAQRQVLGDEAYDVFRHLDLADFIGVRGTLFRTRTGEPSVKVESFTILAKALRPPPAKWHGLEDTEIRYRQRYLDLVANDEVRSVFLRRSAIIREIRAFFHDRGYVEVETPMMQAIPGGAAAQPFKTWHNALGCEFYLRIALELYLKRLLVGGMDRVFELGRNFRNEGLSRRHNPEFTMLEAYEAYGDCATMMELVESLVGQVATRVLGTRVIERDPRPLLGFAIQRALSDLDRLSAQTMTHLMKRVGGDLAARFVADMGKARAALVAAGEAISTSPPADVAQQAIGALLIATGALALHQAGASQEEAALEPHLIEAAGRFDAAVRSFEGLAVPRRVDLTPPWRRVRYKDLVREVAGADWFEVTPTERRRRAIEDLKLAGDIAAGYEDFEVTGAVFEKLVEPTLIQPTFVTHLPKELVPLAKLSPEDPSTVEVFECCINGQEIAPGYTEQNDPLEQRERLEHQAGGEQQKLDEDFLVALEHGMPPAGGIGLGIDRLCMLLLGQESIRDVILFPQLKPK